MSTVAQSEDGAVQVPDEPRAAPVKKPHKKKLRKAAERAAAEAAAKQATEETKKWGTGRDTEAPAKRWSMRGEPEVRVNRWGNKEYSQGPARRWGAKPDSEVTARRWGNKEDSEAAETKQVAKNEDSEREPVEKSVEDSDSAKKHTSAWALESDEQKLLKEKEQSAITALGKVPKNWREFTDLPAWKRQKFALLEKFGEEGWNPRKKLSPESMEGIRALHVQHPEVFPVNRLAELFKISPEAIRRILRSKWRPATEEELKERDARWQARGKRILEKWREDGIIFSKKDKQMRKEAEANKVHRVVSKKTAKFFI
ncbi:Required for respiratory growth protein 9 mitochondrial [Saitoella coloradoensis]